MPDYKLELGPYVVNLTCECCHKPVLRVWGFVSKDGWAHAVYYALLAGHEDVVRRVEFSAGAFLLRIRNGTAFRGECLDSTSERAAG